MREDPPWLREAQATLGLREIPGAPTEPRISAWLKALGAWWRDDETPWCGTACAAWFRPMVNELPRHWYRAKAWLDWGRPMPAPVRGCIVVFERPGGGHVGLVWGQDHQGRLLVIGGNQGNAVSIAPFDRGRVLGYRWPKSTATQPPVLALAGWLPTFDASAPSSVNEA